MLGDAQEESANKGTMVAQSQGVGPVALLFWNRLIARSKSADCQSGGSYAANSSNNAFASFRSSVSNPSVNHP